MPTRFWVKKTGNPSSIKITKAVIKKMGEKSIKRNSAKGLVNIRMKRI